MPVASPLPLPDLVAFNAARPRRASTRGSSAAGCAAGPGRWWRPMSCSCACVAVISRPACRVRKSCSPTSRRCRPTCAAMTAIRSRPSPASGASSWPIDEYPPLVVNAFISAEDKTFFSHGGLDYPGLVGAVFDYTPQVGQRRARRGRLDDHPAGRQVSASGRRIFDHPQDPRGDPRLPARGSTLTQAADPRALPQPDLPRPQRLWRAGRERAPISTRTSPT